MQSPAWYWRRLRRMSLDELVWRLNSAARASVDAAKIGVGMNLVRPVSPEACRRRGFSVVESGPQRFRDDYAARSSESRKTLLAAAERLISHRLDIFDIVVTWHDEIDWHRDYSAGKHAPEQLAALVDYRKFDVVGDCKLVWEVNRHHHWVVLARAYYASGDPRFAAEVIAQYRSWRKHNRFYFGMNWCSPLELGVRLINWVWAFDLIRDAGGVDDILDDVGYAIRQHCWYISRYRSKASSANNHLIGEAAGLFVAASYLPDMEGAAAWLRESREILEQQIQAQSFDDGCTREHAFGYQFFVIQFFAVCGVVARTTGRDFSPQYWARLEKMIEFLVTLGRAHGTPPLVGDCDDGYVLNLGDHPHDWRAVARIGSSLFGRADWAIESGEAVTWLPLRPVTANTTAPRPRQESLQSRAFANAGYYLLCGSDADGKTISALFDCADLGFGALAAHGHADALSFVVSWDGQPVLVDTGTYDYFTYPAWRNFFRSTRAHNALEIDGVDQSVMSGPFMWSSRASARCLTWAPRVDGGQVSGEHDGYARLPNPVRHRRTLDVAAQKGTVEILDEIESASGHEVRRYFHFDPQWRVVEQAGGKVVVAAGARRVSLTADGSSLAVIEGSADDVGPGWMSTGYHRKARSVSIVATDAVAAPTASLRAELRLEHVDAPR